MNMAIEQYALAFVNTTPTEAVGMVAREVFRPYKFYTNVEAPEIAFLDGIYLGSDPQNQLLAEVDLWGFSTIHVSQLRAAFYEEHGLMDKTDSQIQAYLDEHELSPPDVVQLDLPTLTKDQRIRMTGRFPVLVGFSVFGHVPAKPIVRRW